ncbi:zinc-finger domain-containing protein [Tropicimonas sp. TH_r6]|uniref:zinc-finger domain-containing protein n=1 Tax=Tropicimonas sp. TH_r6 TaxID=3082085 RepID=UPI002953E20E|nr:zinc-finger domain-containing protein [Tropicimonas sp. TH_r6]MDV7144208.1 zinc-finger domain-containing protein [Tropicimonas sp. TH_r6]
MSVNPQPPETEVVTASRVACDGGDGALGHPRIWLTLGESGEVECPYCGKRFVSASKAETD